MVRIFICLLIAMQATIAAAEAAPKANKPAADKKSDKNSDGEARVIGENEKNEIIQKLITAARISSQKGERQKAINLYRLILSIDPSIAPARFSLAEEYLLLKQYDQASYHFKIVLAQDIPDKIALLVKHHLATINKRKIWSVTFNAYTTPQTNINQGSTENIIMIGGVPFILNDDSKKQSGTAMSAELGIAVAPELSEHFNGHFKLSASGDYIDQTKVLNYNLGTEAGLIYRDQTDRYGAGIAFNRQYFDKKPYSNRFGVWTNWDKLISNQLTYSGRVEVGKKKILQNNGIDYDFAINQSFSFEMGSNFGFAVAPSYSILNSHNNLLDHYTAGLSVSTRHTLPKNFTLTTNISANYSKYKVKNNLFNKFRSDLTWGTRLRVANSQFTIFNLAPYAQYQYQKRNSNINLYDFSNHAVRVGFTRQF